MQPWETVDRASAPDGTELILARRGEEWVVRAGGHVLMSSRVHGSEEALAALALRKAENRRAVLLGGLGLGFTLRALLDRLPVDAKVVVTELLPELAGWNREHLSHLAGRPLDDRRVRLQLGDVLGRIAESKGAYDAIVLDVDNGPSALAHAGNQKLYKRKGVDACLEALRAGGVLAVWSAGPDEAYLERLTRAGFAARAEVVPARQGGGQKHVVFLAKKAAARPGRPGPAAAGARAPRRATKRPS